MSEFKRNPSKVWWASESVEWREVSSSPGSQDSGFSDTETSPHLKAQQNEENNMKTPSKDLPARRVPKDIFKELASDEKPLNLSANYIEKSTPTKSISTKLIKSETKVVTPKNSMEFMPKSEPTRKMRYTKNSPKVSRNLFNTKQKEVHRDVNADNQYSNSVNQEITDSNNTSEESCVDSHCWQSEESTYDIYNNQSLPILHANRNNLSPRYNRTAPGVLELEILRRHRDDEAVTSFNSSLSSDCESELECLFNDQLDSPQHTSTPKTPSSRKMILRRAKLPVQLFLKCSPQRVPPIHTDGEVDNKAVEMWMNENRHKYEQECMTTLQCKSIAGELNQKVSHLAAFCSTNIRGVLGQSRCIETEYRNLNSEKKHVGPLLQSLAGNINDFINTYSKENSTKYQRLYDEIRSSNPEDALKLLSQLFAIWEAIQESVLAKEIKNLIENLEKPVTELNLRATVTAITSIALRNDELIELFIKADVIPILLILCEKCEGSTMRSLLLRALSTMCSNSFAVRQFEKFSGVEIIADTIEEASRPEPERSEAIALLAQVTAPWLEDNHCVKGLQDYSRILVKSLTKFLSSTRCCQNILLATAALANISTMDTKSIQYMLHSNTIIVVLETVKSRGPMASVYLLEQVATLVANMSAVETARQQLGAVNAPVALLRFLQVNHKGDDVGKRLQQKSIIALSRLCGDREAASQVVKLGGVEKLVKLCREKSERYDNDAVLVAALATLRKISDSCGSEVINAQDAQELVEPKLLDSFLAYSSQNESYV